jgi:hypothetical protein
VNLLPDAPPTEQSTAQGRPRTNLIATLQQQELERVGRELAAKRGLAFALIEEAD